MTRNGWEEGRITLPSAEYAKVRQAVQVAMTAHKEKVFDLTQVFWKGLTRAQQTDPAQYLAAAHKFFDSRYVDDRGAGFTFSRRPAPDNSALQDAFSEIVDSRRMKAPSRVLQADMDFPTNRSTDFHVDDLEVSFDKKTGSVQWCVNENNDAVNDARNHPLGKAVFSALGQVRWTRGTGGIITGNDEYNGGDTDADRGENYVSVAFGPAGADEAPDQCLPYTDSKGRRVTQADLDAAGLARQEAIWDAQRRAAGAKPKTPLASGPQPRGHNGHAGKYTYRNRSESPVTL